MDTVHIMLIRHAEKPGPGQVGLDAEGQATPLGLSAQGWQRAGALVRLFAPLEGVSGSSQIERPVHLFAARASGEHLSQRPRDTLAPLALELGLTIDQRCGVEDALPAFAQSLRRLSGPVLVCWRHGSLPALAAELTGRTDLPGHWPDARFDLVWVVHGVVGGLKLSQVPQRLLALDSARGIVRRVERG